MIATTSLMAISSGTPLIATTSLTGRCQNVLYHGSIVSGAGYLAGILESVAEMTWKPCWSLVLRRQNRCSPCRIVWMPSLLSQRSWRICRHELHCPSAHIGYDRILWSRLKST